MLIRDQRGTTLVGQVLAVAFVGITLTFFLGGLATSNIGVHVVEQRINGENLARQQMDLIKSPDLAPYRRDPTAVPYPTLPAATTAGYQVRVIVNYWNPDTQAFTDTVPASDGQDHGLQHIRIEVRPLRQLIGQKVFVLEDYKGQRPTS